MLNYLKSFCINLSLSSHFGDIALEFVVPSEHQFNRYIPYHDQRQFRYTTRLSFRAKCEAQFISFHFKADWKSPILPVGSYNKYIDLGGDGFQDSSREKHRIPPLLNPLRSENGVVTVGDFSDSSCLQPLYSRSWLETGSRLMQPLVYLYLPSSSPEL